MKPINRLSLIAALGVIALGLVLGAATAWPESRAAAQPLALAGTPSPGSLLPGRATATPGAFASLTPGTAARTPLVTSPLNFPTSVPDIPATPGQDCTQVFPLENVEAIEFGQTSIPQLEASFGQPVYRGGRPTRFRFEESGCILLVTIGVREAQEAELVYYGTLDTVLDHYGPPAAAGVSEGNLALVFVGSTLLFYPEQGVIARFDVGPDELTRDTPVSSLILRPPYDLGRQLTALKVEPVEWLPPLR